MVLETNNSKPVSPTSIATVQMPNHNETENKSKNNKRKNSAKEPKEKRRKTSTSNEMPKDMPLRPLSAYNIFFSEQRKVILDEIDRKEHPEGQASDSSSEEKKTTTTTLGDSVPSVMKQRRLV